MRSALVPLCFFGCVRPEAAPPPAPRPIVSEAPIAPVPQIATVPAEPAIPVIRISVEHEEAIDAAVLDAIARRATPGAVVLIGRRDGVIFRRAYGARALDPEREPMTEDTIFDLASVTKASATAMAAMWLVERGTLELDAPASRWIPELDPRITVRSLLTHSSGLPAVDFLTGYEAGREAALARIFATRISAPGRFVYSDLGFIVLGEIVARASGRSLDRLVAEEIHGPLGMRDTTFAVADRARVAPTERAERRGGVMIRGEVHDPRSFRLGGVAGNAGLFSTADDLGRLARALMNEGELDGERVLAPETVRAMTSGTRRSLGWEIGHRELSPRAFGHEGFTGTALWIDPEHDVFVVFLSNRVHPDGRGDVQPLVRTIAGIARAAAGDASAEIDAPVSNGIDVLRRDGFSAIAGARVALLTHDAARARDGRRTLDLIASAPGVTLVRVLVPEHGLSGRSEGRIRDARDPRTGVAVHSLFGPAREPTPEMLEGIDTIVIDLQDVGARFYTYGATLGRVLAAAAEHGLRVVVLDRPEPMGGGDPRGPVCEDELRSFVNHHALPAVHGMTIGELASFLDDERDLGVRLTVVPVEGWRRGMTYRETGLRWVPPSPNLRTPEEVLLYPAVALVEGTNVSVGRGTETPFEVIGAPWIDPTRLIEAIGEQPGLRLSATRFTPRAAVHRGVPCRGVRIEIDGAFDPIRAGLAIARGLSRFSEWDREAMLPMIGDRAIHRALVDGAETEALIGMCEPRLSEFASRRARHLRY